MEPFEHVIIVGCGLLGASLGMALREKRLARLVTGVGRAGSDSVRIALRRGAIDFAADDLAAACAGSPDAQLAPADLVVICTPVRQFPEMFQRMAPGLKPGAIVTDVGSTKQAVMNWAAELLPAHATFVGSHPMAGSEKSGPDHARPDLYRNAVCLVCGGAAPPAAVERVSALWRELQMRVILCEPQLHDRWVATISHLPHVMAACLVNTVAADKRALDAAASGFIDTTRIASGDVAMWTDILLTNRHAVVAMLGQLEGDLAAVKQAVERGDERAIERFLHSAKTARDAFIAGRQAV